ncbi:MAG: hypothetical protein E6700_08785 [Winkia neuii]|nr:hypothetical protein [Winkia neuii]KWZ72200.1 hypothetical protein HMPREF3198_02068 [Winkia neuii]MDK8100398.1 hypothetical protein [Winkia neuii]MDU3135650.1 hypothetical protein [Winkia neuii]
MSQRLNVVRLYTELLAKQVNNEAAAIVQAHPDRYGLFASLPEPAWQRDSG